MYLKTNNMSCYIRNHHFNLANDITLDLTENRVLRGFPRGRKRAIGERMNTKKGRIKHGTK